MFDFIRKPIFLIILAVALIAAAIWAYVSNRSSQQTQNTATTNQTSTDTTNPTTTTSISNLTNVDAAEMIDGINAQLAIADAKAIETDKKMLLSAIQVSLPGTMEKGMGTTYYVYSSVNDTTNNWVIAMSNIDNKFVRSRTPKSDFIGEVAAVNRGFLKTSYVSAIQIAEKNGGQIYRETNPLTEVRLVLKNSGDKSWLYWNIDYVSKVGQKQFQIDASSGTIVAPKSSE